MKITRVFADTRGESHFAEEDIELDDRGSIGFLSEPLQAREVIFRRNPPDYDYDWHVAPARQLVVLLNGKIEIEVSDGTKRTFSGGDLLELSDTTGKGHRTRNVEAVERYSLFVILD